MGAVTGERAVVRRAVTQFRQPVRQALLLALVALDAMLHLTSGATFTSLYAAGLLLLMLTTGWTVAASLVPRLAEATTVVLLLDLAAVGVMRLVPEGNGLGFLAVLVALWLGMDLCVRGVLLSFVGSAVLVAWPSLAYFGMQEAWLSRALVLPVTAVVCALTTATATRAWAAQSRELEEQGARLQEALEAVEADRALNDAIVSTVDVGLVALSRSGEYRTMNPRHTEFMELAFPDGHAGVAGQDGFVFAADRATRVQREEMPSIRAMQGEEFVDHVIWVGREPARQRALSVSAGPVVDEEGRFDGAVLVYKDITELMSALKVKDEFVASVSHELRTPLTVVMGYLDLVLMQSDPESTVHQHLQVARRNAHRLLTMVDDLLLTARFDEGRLIVDLQDTDLAALVTEAMADHGPRAQEAGVTLESRVEGPVVLAADRVRIRQVVDNLLSNAVKYTPAGGSVSVVLEQVGDEVDLVVADSGIGISAADQQLLFTKFFRAAQAEKMAIPGIGLGLAITTAIVQAHHGRLEVESEEGSGSRFRVRLPSHRIRDFMTDEPGRTGATSPVLTKPLPS